jgi:hypothetical protein
MVAGLPDDRPETVVAELSEALEASGEKAA